MPRSSAWQKQAQVRKVDIGVKFAFSRLAVALGAAECAATQTVHLADSVAFE